MNSRPSVVSLACLLCPASGNEGPISSRCKECELCVQIIQIKYNTADSDDDVVSAAEGHSEVITDDEKLEIQ